MKAVSLKYRAGIPAARRVVIKLGSRVLVQRTGRPDKRRMMALSNEVAALHKRGHEVAVVTSGAVGAGMEALRMRTRPTSLPEIQMAAAVGQARLMTRYAEYLGRKGLVVGQVLLTHGNFTHKVQQMNARHTVELLLRRGVIPIINENDVVSDEEIKADLAFGDNDYLAALLVKLIRADLLILLSTVDGVREPVANGRTKRVRFLDAVTRKTMECVKANTDGISKGGMGSKLKAAQLAASSGCAVVIANGCKEGVLQSIMSGADTGTLIVPSAL